MTDITMLTVAVRTMTAIRDDHGNRVTAIRGGSSWDLSGLRGSERIAISEMQDFGFTVSDKYSGVSISFMGVRATSTAGVAGAMSNWINAAGRRIGA